MSPAAPACRLTDVTSPMYGSTGAHYGYDVLDNLSYVVAPGRDHWYCYANNQLTNIKTDGCSGGTVIGLGYDVQGNLQNKNVTTFAFDYGNRLRQAAGEAYRYDAWGRRTRADSSAGLIYSLYNQAGQLLWTRDERSGQRRQYVYLQGSLLAEHMRPIGSSTMTITYQHTDALGTPVVKTSASRVILERREYEPYGKLLNLPLASGPGFTGHDTDPDTWYTYMQQRYYDPRVARFWSVDPVTASSAGGNFNRDWYGNNNPYRFTDPDGRVAQLITHKDGTQTLQIKVKFTGENATAQNINDIEQRVEGLKIANSKVTIDLVAVMGKVGSDANTMNLGSGFDIENFPTAGEGIKPIGSEAYGGKRSLYKLGSSKRSWCCSTRVHFSGMQDHYRDLPGSSPGHRRTEPLFGFGPDDIMVDRRGSSISSTSVHEMLQNWSTQHLED